MVFTTSAKIFAQALRVIPGGVNSPVRAWRAVGGNPFFVQRARGSWLIDVDGEKYLDYVGSWGAVILGHNHSKVVAVLQEAVRHGTNYGAPTIKEVELANLIVEAFPSIDKVRLVNSGTEATMTAIRLARAFTGRSKIVKFAGCYHGHADALLVRAGSGGMTFGVPDSAGIPETYAHLTLVAEFNNIESVEAYFRAEGKNIAAVIIEPVPGNMGVVPPIPRFLQGLRQLTAQEGAVLIFDEVISGFRLTYGGAQELYGVYADLTCLGKIIGGGLPMGAVGGRREIMDQLAPDGAVYQASTWAGNPLAVAAGMEVLRQLAQPGTYQRLEKMGQLMGEGLRNAMRSQNIKGCVNQVGSMFTLFLGLDKVGSYLEARQCGGTAFSRFFQGMLRRGIYLPPSQFEAAFLSLAHSEEDVSMTVRAAADTLREQ